MAEAVRGVIIVVRCEHFIYGLFPNIGYRLIATPRLPHLICASTFTTLKNLGMHADSKVTFQIYWEAERVISVSTVRPMTDVHGRKGVWNHTILISLDDYLKLTQPHTILAPFSIAPLNDPPRTLSPLVVGGS
jgi:hypothetical protein